MKTDTTSNTIASFTFSGRLRLLAFLLVFALIYSFALVILQGSRLVRDWENRFQSQFYLIRSHFSEPVASELPLVLVMIDDHSLPVNSPRSPIDRSWLADLVEQLAKREPVLIAVNILLDRPGNQAADQKLRNSINQAGNVVLRTDPFYPVYPFFAAAALDRGTLRFRLDSSDVVQDVCASRGGCQSEHIFYKKILDYYRFATGGRIMAPVPNQSWLKINFSLTGREGSHSKFKSFPVLRAHEVFQLPKSAFKHKVVLLGTGFPDLYPLYRVPLSEPDLMLQETEVIAQVLNMVAGETYLTAYSRVRIGLLVFGLMVLISLTVVFRGPLSGALASFAMIALLYGIAGWLFAFQNKELPFVLPAIVLILFAVTAILIYSLRERFFRLNAELNLKQAKIDFLTNELHSHHLFNEFSRLSVMIQQDPKSAKEYLVEFAEMLRSSLKYGDQAMVPVGVQIDYLESYLKQQQMIYREQMVFQFVKADGIQTLLAPWHAFFPLLENAVKYTEALIKQKSMATATIEIVLETTTNSLKFTVKNPYAPEIKPVSSKTGLKNLKNRLALAYPGGGYGLEFSHDGLLWIAELTLPVQRGSDRNTI